MHESVDATVLERFRQGDQQTVGKLLDRLRPYIRVIVRSARGDQPGLAADESDLIQDVILLAVRAAGTFRGDNFGELIRWLRTIAVRRSREALMRAAGREPSAPARDFAMADAGARGPEEILVQQENAARMAAALNRLPEEMRQVLLWRLVDGLGHNQIAERMNRSPGAVRMLFLRAVERLREVCGTPEEWVSE